MIFVFWVVYVLAAIRCAVWVAHGLIGEVGSGSDDSADVVIFGAVGLMASVFWPILVAGYGIGKAAQALSPTRERLP